MVEGVTAPVGLDQRLADLLDTLGRSSDAMIAIGTEMEIIGWNEAATRLFGHRPDEVMGRPCDEVLCWRDRCGDPVCEGCPASEAGAEDELVDTREVIGRTSEGKTLWLSATTVVPPLELRDQCRLVHLIREVGLPPELERLVVDRLGGWSLAVGDEPPQVAALTPREREVLTLLSEGLDGPTIAARLFVSQTTVRNHIQHILNKLGVHSRAEAVAFTLRHR